MEEFLIRVSWSARPEHLIRRGEVTVDVGVASPPEPPLSEQEMQTVAWAAKLAALKCVRARKKARP